MVLLIIIPFLNGYFIGNINPTFSDKPTWFLGTGNKHDKNHGIWDDFGVRKSLCSEPFLFQDPKYQNHPNNRLIYAPTTPRTGVVFVVQCCAVTTCAVTRLVQKKLPQPSAHFLRWVIILETWNMDFMVDSLGSTGALAFPLRPSPAISQ